MKGGGKKKEIFFSERQKIKNKQRELKTPEDSWKSSELYSQGFKRWDEFSSCETKGKSVNEAEAKCYESAEKAADSLIGILKERRRMNGKFIRQNLQMPF